VATTPTAICHHLISSEGNSAIEGDGRVYVQAVLNGIPQACLLDSGCGTTVFPRQLIPTAALKPTKQRMNTATGATLKLDGEADVLCDFGGLSLKVHGVVSSQIYEVMLGQDFLIGHNVSCRFGEFKMSIYNREFTLSGPSSTNCCRRLVLNVDSEPSIQAKSDEQQGQTVFNTMDTNGTSLTNLNGEGHALTVLVSAPLENPVMDSMTAANGADTTDAKEMSEANVTQTESITLTNQTPLDFSALQRWLNEDANRDKCDTEDGFKVHQGPLNQSNANASEWIDCDQSHPRQYRRRGRNKARMCTSAGGCTDDM
jgi:hypothetical protein